APPRRRRYAEESAERFSSTSVSAECHPELAKDPCASAGTSGSFVVPPQDDMLLYVHAQSSAWLRLSSRTYNMVNARSNRTDTTPYALAAPSLNCWNAS